MIYSNPVDGGTDCTQTNGTIRTTKDCTNIQPCPVNCVGSWLLNGNCTGACGGGNGTLPELFNVSTAAANNGTDCEAAHGATRSSTPCTNASPCPINCTGSWVATEISLCNGTCGGGEGLLPETYVVTVAAAHSGSPCPYSDHTVRYVPCNNTAPCPVDCVGSWVANGSCSGTVNTTYPEVFNVTTAADFNGSGCEAVHGATRNITRCPVNCVGAWHAIDQCNGVCGGHNGTLPERYNVTTPAAYNGTDCEAADGAARNITSCITGPCPVPCGGVWLESGCSGACDGGSGFILEAFNITQVAWYGGSACPEANGMTRLSSVVCTNSAPCPVNCVGGYMKSGECTGTCDTAGSGFLPEVYVITTEAAFGGQACSSANGSTRAATPCINQSPCACVGQWVPIVACTAMCSSTDILPERYHITRLPTFGGQECTVANGSTRWVLAGLLLPGPYK